MSLFSQEFLVEIKSLALQIAMRQRGETHMQDLPTLHKKFQAEEQELAEASEPWDELPDIAYYAACMKIVLSLSPDTKFAYEMIEDIEPSLLYYSEKYHFSIRQLEAGTLAKYRLRATQPKNFEAERTAILAAIS